MAKKDIKWFDHRMQEIQSQFSDFVQASRIIKPRFEAFKIVSLYIIIGSLWILLSDKILSFFIKDDMLIHKIELFKGWFYVLVTGIVFYVIIVNRMKLFKKAIARLFDGYEELSATHEELMAMDEELTQQYDELEKHRNALIVSDQRYSLAVEGANDGIWDWDIPTDTYFFSLKWKSVFGYEENELENSFSTWEMLLHPDDQKRSVNAVFSYLQAKKGIYSNTYRIRCKDGQYRWILSRGKAIWDAEGNAIRFAGSHTDITEQVMMQEYLRQEKEFSESIIRDAPMIVFVIDRDGKLIKVNPFAEVLTGYKKDELTGKKGTDILVPECKRQMMDELFEQIITGQHLKNNELEILCKDGRAITVLWFNNLLHDEKGEIQGVVSVGMDVTQQRQFEKELHFLAYHDHLTKLPNRITLEEAVNRQLHAAVEQKRKFALIYLDIDNFKHINDTMGHGVGDKLVVYIANILSYQVKAPNMVARIGGDEFAILLVDIKDENDVVNEINRIQKYVRRPWILEKQEFFISVSMGVAIYPEHGTDMKTLMQNADTSMFYVKEKGKDNFCIFSSEMREKTWHFIQMSNQLRTAVSNEEFLLYYQPKIDLGRREIIGVEALIRWIHPEKGFISPMDFIPFAERTGYIFQIGEWVFETACKQKKLWEEKGYCNVKVSVNISGTGLTQNGLIPRIKSVIEEYGLNYCELELEITETAVMADLERAIEVLKQLK